jgi:hypothetical protein
MVEQAAVVHNIRMDKDEKRNVQRGAEAQAHEEATERSRRLRAWLDGVLKGGPQPTEIAAEWRRGMEFYEAQKLIPEDEEDRATKNVKPVEELLLNAVQAIRKRRQAEGKPLDEISEEERKWRFVEMVERLKKDGAEGREATPMDLVLAARYMEGVLGLEEYLRAVGRV